jgi:peptidoglycan/LPS O-acetylase OafA/YrhL
VLAGRTNIPGLDGIRGLAVLIVFIFHAEILPHVPGELATTTFFFLSGFLITTLFLREWKKTGDISLGNFYFRRAMRILPPLYIALFIAYAAHHWGHVGDPLVPWKVAGNFFQYTNYAMTLTQDAAGFLPGMVLLWSLAVDEHYYLFWAPFMRYGVRHLARKRMCAVVVTVCVAALAWRVFSIHQVGDATFRVSMATDARLDSILWGALLALWKNPASEPEAAAWLAKPLPVLVGLFLVLAPSLTGNDDFKCSIGYTLEGLGFFPLFTAAVLYGGKGVLKFLHWPWLLWMSRISYSFYLFSWFMLSVCRKFIHYPKPVVVGLAFMATLLIASGMHLAVERPLMALRKKAKRQARAVVNTPDRSPDAVVA